MDEITFVLIVTVVSVGINQIMNWLKTMLFKKET
jgi:hypothetical protein